MLQTMQQNP
jgi:hypothetical protein